METSDWNQGGELDFHYLTLDRSITRIMFRRESDEMIDEKVISDSTIHLDLRLASGSHVRLVSYDHREGHIIPPSNAEGNQTVSRTWRSC